MSQREGESTDVSPLETRALVPEFLTGRLAWIALSALTSLVLASVAFAQGAWDGGEVADTRTPAVEPDRAVEAVSPAPAEGAAPEPVSGLTSTQESAGPEADRASARRPGKDAPSASAREHSASGATDGASRAGGDTAVPQAAPDNRRSRPQPRPKPPRSRPAAQSQSRLAAKVRPSLSAWSSRDPENSEYLDGYTVTVRSTVPLTSLKMSVRVIQTGGVTNAGTWTSLGDRADVRFAVNGDQLAYHVTLKSGVTLRPGTYTFQLAFHHDRGTRDAGHDLWNTVATADEFAGSRLRSGHF